MEKIPQGKYETLSYDAVIASIHDELKTEQSDQDFFIERNLNKAVRRLDCLNIFKKQETNITVSNGVAPLPCGYNKILGLRLNETSNQHQGCVPAIYVDLNFVRGCGCNNIDNLFPFNSAFEIQDSAIVLHQGFSQIESVKLSYFGLDLNEDGLMKIYVDMEDALVAYVCYKYARQNFREYPRDIREDFKSEWIAQKKWLRSIAFYDNFQETRWQIAEWSNALVVDKVFSP